MRGGLLAAWLAGMGIVTWRMVHRDHRLPVPGQMMAITGLFAAGALTADVWPASATLVTVTLWGLDVAALLNALPAGLAQQIGTATAAEAGANLPRSGPGAVTPIGG